MHGRYLRRLADLAWQGTPVRVHLQVRWFCRVAAPCPRQTFTERHPLGLAGSGWITATWGGTVVVAPT